MALDLRKVRHPWRGKGHWQNLREVTFLLSHCATAPSTPGWPNFEKSRSHADLVGIIWTSDQPDAKTST